MTLNLLFNQCYRNNINQCDRHISTFPLSYCILSEACLQCSSNSRLIDVFIPTVKIIFAKCNELINYYILISARRVLLCAFIAVYTFRKRRAPNEGKNNQTKAAAHCNRFEMKHIVVCLSKHVTARSQYETY